MDDLRRPIRQSARSCFRLAHVPNYVRGMLHEAAALAHRTRVAMITVPHEDTPGFAAIRRLVGYPHSNLAARRSTGPMPDGSGSARYRLDRQSSRLRCTIAGANMTVAAHRSGYVPTHGSVVFDFDLTVWELKLINPCRVGYARRVPVTATHGWRPVGCIPHLATEQHDT